MIMIITIIIIIVIVIIIIIIINMITIIINDEFLFEITTILPIIKNILYAYKYNNQNTWKSNVTQTLFVDILNLFR